MPPRPGGPRQITEGRSALYPSPVERRTLGVAPEPERGYRSDSQRPKDSDVDNWPYLGQCRRGRVTTGKRSQIPCVAKEGNRKAASDGSRDHPALSEGANRKRSATRKAQREAELVGTENPLPGKRDLTSCARLLMGDCAPARPENGAVDHSCSTINRRTDSSSSVVECDRVIGETRG